MKLRTMIEATETGIDEIGAYLDGLNHDDRLAEVYSLRSRDQRDLFARAESAPPLSLKHFVPDSVAPLTPVIHYGKNSLPLFRIFQKRFSRPGEGDDKLFGYNEGFTRFFIGPGYFVTIPTAGHPDWEARGAVVVDYFQVPEEAVPAEWPAVKPNSRGLQRFVYYQTRDFMRRVSEHVSVGAAFKVEKAMGAYFMLCREPLDSDPSL